MALKKISSSNIDDMSDVFHDVDVDVSVVSPLVSTSLNSELDIWSSSPNLDIEDTLSSEVHPVIQFTDEQHRVIEHRMGHALVSAVAGSGKTEVLVARVTAMLHEQFDPERMLILMFNKSAQEVFLSRLRAQNKDSTLPGVFTFHALGLYILNLARHQKGLPDLEVIVDESLWAELIRDAVADLNMKQGLGVNSHPDQLRKYLGYIDAMKNLDYPHQLLDTDKLDWSAQSISFMPQLFSVFEQLRKTRNMIGLNDLLYQAVTLLREDTALANAFQGSIDHILVDEYQDSNPLQHWLLKRLTHAQSSVMVVGDEDQCIYTWRAADPDMMVRGFELQYPNVTRYTLSKTFRYGHAIALMANHVLMHNIERPKKIVVSGTGAAGNVELVRSNNPGDIELLLRRLDGEDAILVREFRHAGDIELLMQWYGLPYRLEGSVPFPRRAHGRALRVSIACAMSNHQSYRPEEEDARAWIRWVDPEASSAMVDILASGMHKHGIEKGIRIAIDRGTISQRQQQHLVKLLVLNGRLNDIGNQPDPVDSIRRRMLDQWARAIVKDQDRPSPPMFLRVLDLMVDLTLEQLSTLLDEWKEHTVGPLLTSIHRAKGGGWPRVFLPHTEAGIFPGEVSEEERRLFYVGITRAKQELLLWIPEDRLRDTLWRDPVGINLSEYKGPTGLFVLESMPEYSKKMADVWVQTHSPSPDVLSGCARQYEALLFPNIGKSKQAISKFSALFNK